jgi:transcriptional regulator with XRE-family HTH domain
MTNIIKEVRSELGLRQKDFAPLAGFNTVQQVSQLERNVYGLGLNRISKMVRNLCANGYQVSVDISVTVNDKTIVIH